MSTGAQSENISRRIRGLYRRPACLGSRLSSFRHTIAVIGILGICHDLGDDQFPIADHLQHLWQVGNRGQVFQASLSPPTAKIPMQTKETTTLSASTFPKNNNLEWLRLIFALQVVVSHAGSYFGFELPVILSHFPGVPAFFFVSGFLIYASWLNAPGRGYFENRFLRLFPGLALVTFGGAAVALIAHGWRDLIEHFNVYALWFFAQTTLGQSYNPSHFRDIGVGVINGSLWTLTTEILFYLSVPIIAWLERQFRFALILLITLSFAIYVVGPLIGSEVIYRKKTFYDVVALTPIAWGWMFGFGMLALKHFDLVRRWLKFLPIFMVPITVLIFFGSGNETGGPWFASQGSRLGLFYFTSYAGLVLWFAFATPFVPLPFDLSYGCYIWHMPVINLMLLLAMPSMSAAILMTITIAALSWFVVERPSLKLKRRSLKPIAEPDVNGRGAKPLSSM